MNLLGHVRVALDSSQDDLHVLGAILPDVESLLGQRLHGARDRPEVAAGIALHRATDAAFHSDPRFVSGSIALTRALLARGVGRGASRAVGHAGWEMLLDGLLVEDRATTDAFTRAADRLAALAAVEDATTDRLSWFAERQRHQPIWAAYADPEVVADRLHRQLSTRPRLTFGRDQLPEIADELARAAVQIGSVGRSLIQDVSRAANAP